MDLGVDCPEGVTEGWAAGWEVAYRLPVSVDQAVLGMGFLRQTLHNSAMLVSVGLVVRGGEEAAPRSWLWVSAPDVPAPITVLRSLIEACVPWLGLTIETVSEPLEALDVTTGSVFSLHRLERVSRVSSSGSVLWRLLRNAHGPWQLTVMAGPGDPQEDEVDLGLSIVGSGEEVLVAAPMLDSDAEGLPIGLRPRFIDGPELALVRDLAIQGRAPSSGFAPSSFADRLLAAPARLHGQWPLLDSAPAQTHAIQEAVDGAVPPHVLVQGGSGLGKTTLLDQLIQASLDGGATVAVVCPHGDLARRAATRLTAAGVDVDGYDFGSEEPVQWNLTSPDRGVDPEEHVSLLLEVVRSLWLDGDAEWFGPVWTRLFRAMLAVLALDPAGPWPLTRLPELIAERSVFREAALRRINDPSITAVIKAELLPMVRARDAGNAAAWLVSKADPLIADPTMRSIVGTRGSEFDVSGLLRQRSLVVSIPESRLTADGARLLAAMTVGRVWRLALRYQLPAPVHLFIDEWQKIPIPDISRILSEGRKFGLHLRLANQTSSQIPRRLWETAIGNSGAVVSFRASPGDAQLLGGRFLDLGAKQLMRLPDHWVAVSEGSRDFLAKTYPPETDSQTAGPLAELHAVQVARARRSVLLQIKDAISKRMHDRDSEVQTDHTIFIAVRDSTGIDEAIDADDDVNLRDLLPDPF